MVSMKVRIGRDVSATRKAVWIGLLVVFSAVLFAVGWFRMFLNVTPPVLEALAFNLGAAGVMWGIIVIAVRPRLAFPWSLVVLMVAGTAPILYGAWRTGAVLDGGASVNPAQELAEETPAEPAYVNPSRMADQ